MRRTPLRRRSLKGTDADEHYRDAIMAVNDRDRGECRVAERVPEVRCAGPRDPHHVAGRRGQMLYDVPNILTACRAHHDWIHAHTRAARERGLLA